MQERKGDAGKVKRRKERKERKEGMADPFPLEPKTN